MKFSQGSHRIYDGEGDKLMANLDEATDKVILLPDSAEGRKPDAHPKTRLMWGQNLLEDIVAGRYNTLVCGVNAADNARGIIAQVAACLPTSQWDAAAVTAHAKRFINPNTVTVVKYDMDTVEVLALLRPATHEHLTLDDLAAGFRIVSEMIRRKHDRWPSASVSFLGARANKLRDPGGKEPSFESVLRTMHDAGYSGDVYPPTTLWGSSPTGVYARYPFPASIEQMRQGGF